MVKMIKHPLSRALEVKPQKLAKNKKKKTFFFLTLMIRNQSKNR